MIHQPSSRTSPPPGPNRAGQRRRWAARAVYGLLVIEVALVIWYAVAYRQVDFRVYMWGGHNVAHGSRLYLGRASGHWFTYPPFAALLFAPISVLPVVPAQVLWELASVAALSVACAATLKLAGCRAAKATVAAVTAAALALEPMYHTLLQGQVNLILLALVLADVWRASRDRPAGIGVGIAAAVKLTPAIFVLLFLLARRTRAAMTAAGTFLVCGLIGYLAAPGASRLYWTGVFADTKRIDAPYIGNQSPYGAAIRMFGGIAHVGHWYLLLALVIAVAGLAAATAFARRGDWLGAAAVTGAASLLVSPVSWTHHWVWILPALVVLARGGRGGRIAAAGGFLLFALSPLWWTPHSLGHPDYGFHGPLTLVANCYLIAGLAFLAYMTWRARRDQPGGRRAHEAAAVRVGVQPGGAAVTCGKRQGRGVIHRFDAIPLSAAVASLPSVLEWRSGIRSRTTPPLNAGMTFAAWSMNLFHPSVRLALMSGEMKKAQSMG